MKHLLLALCLLLTTGAALAQLDRGPSAYWEFDHNDTPQLRVFPNPAVDYIEVSNSQQVKMLAVYNLVGRRVKTFQYGQGEKYFIGDLPRGMYLVQLIGDRNSVLTTQRVNLR